MRPRCVPLLLVALCAGCGGSARPPATRPTPASFPAPSPATPTAQPPASPPPTATGVASRLPILPPARALLVALMPPPSPGGHAFPAKPPTTHERGVLIGI